MIPVSVKASARSKDLQHSKASIMSGFKAAFFDKVSSLCSSLARAVAASSLSSNDPTSELWYEYATSKTYSVMQR